MTSQTWARREDAGAWMRPLRLGTMMAFLLAGLTCYGAGVYQYRHIWTPAERAYLGAYISSSAAAAGGLWPRAYDLPLGGRPGHTRQADLAR